MRPRWGALGVGLLLATAACAKKPRSAREASPRPGAGAGANASPSPAAGVDCDRLARHILELDSLPATPDNLAMASDHCPDKVTPEMYACALQATTFEQLVVCEPAPGRTSRDASEASRNIEQIYDQAKTYFEDHAASPPGQTGPSPGGTP